jgi:hypothetical protein
MKTPNSVSSEPGAGQYLALNDKKYLESIAKKIMSDFQAEQGRVAVAPKIGDR